jgi:4-hydroxy-tetrahydrodipicolinate reductase
MVSLRAVIEYPNFDLVGVKVYSDRKAGRDAGELCGLGPTGVIATSNIEDIIAAKPDCVVYMPARYDLDDVCRLLESGANVSTLLENFHDPDSLEPEVRQRIEAACQRGGTSIYSAGPSPGFITESVPIVLSTLERRLDRLTIEEFADMSDRSDSPEMFALLGFGGEPATELLSRLEQLTALHFGASLRQLAKALSLPLDDVVSTAQVATARTPVHIAGRIL